jgi:dTDP-4-amino-4,6-dideoxygalactose transaminase
LGKSVEQFEREFAGYLKAPYFLGLASGLDALELSIKVLDLPPNSEILVPSNTYIATVNAILNTGHKPVFVEPDPKTFNIDPARIEAKINANTKGIMIVHLYGLSCDMDPIMAICKKHNLFLFEDCAQSHGATYKGKATGTFGDFGAFSFYPTKNLGALGDAGGITVKTEEMYKKMKAFRNYGSHIKYQNEYIGDNSRLDEVQAAFLSVKLKALNEINSHKRKLASLYHKHLDAAKFIKPTEPDDCEHVYHIYAIRHPERDRLKQYLLEHDIKTDIHYPIPPCDQTSIKNAFSEKGWSIPQEDFVISREIHKTELSLPVSYIHSEKEILQVIDVLNQF